MTNETSTQGISRTKARNVQYAYSYKVAGKWAFPIDMLRYDEAWPEHEFDSALIIQTTEHSSVEAVEIKIVSYRPPTVARWASFGWQVL